jgi:hypothetical protein
MTMLPEDLAYFMAQRQEEPGIWLVTVVGDSFGGTLRFAIDKKPVTSRGNIFKEGYILFEEPGDSSSIPVCKVTIPNIDREIGLALVEMKHGLTIHFELVRDEDPNRVVMSWRNMKLKNAKIDPIVVTGELCAAGIEDEPYSPLRITPSAFPGLYK